MAATSGAGRVGEYPPAKWTWVQRMLLSAYQEGAGHGRFRVAAHEHREPARLDRSSSALLSIYLSARNIF
ncbi:hypothetical protein ZWY2020_013173 [Hordeum vulgare]|nr:hypothetical protein ZWY2020_013173 [Hordeum vulgare]